MIADIQWTRLRTVTLILVLLPLLCHCDNPPPKTTDKINLQLQWVHQGEFAWAYVAKEQGIFEEYGLDVTIIPGGPGIDNVDANLPNDIHFGTLPTDTLLEARQKNAPLVALAMIFQHSAVSFVSLKEAGLLSPQQFVGKKATFSSHSDRAQFITMMRKIGVADPQVSLQSYSYKYAGLLDGSVDVSGAYAVGGVQRLKNSGVELNVCWPFDYGVRFYGDALITKESFLRENPDLSKRFVQAMIKSLQLVLSDPQRAVANTMKYAKEKDATLQTEMINTSLPLISPGEVKLGSIDPGKLQEMNRILYSQQVVKSPDLWESAYSLNYLP